MIRKWDDLPREMKNEQVLIYYNILKNKKGTLVLKRTFDFLMAIILIIILMPVFILLCFFIKIDSKGPIMFRQVRITQYGKRFRIFKFRTMVNNAEKIGEQITTKNDARVTRVGSVLRKLRLDELPQLFNILTGDMSFVGTRPEVVKYTEKYTDEMLATLLLPAGVTSEASIQYKDEEQLLAHKGNTDETYINEVLPSKMIYNLQSIKKFSFFSEIKTMIRTVVAVTKRGNQSGISLKQKSEESE